MFVKHTLRAQTHTPTDRKSHNSKELKYIYSCIKKSRDFDIIEPGVFVNIEENETRNVYLGFILIKLNFC